MSETRLYHWVEWDMWDKRSRKYAIIEKKIIFEKNYKNGIICVTEPNSIMREKLKDDVELWRKKQGSTTYMMFGDPKSNS